MKLAVFSDIHGNMQALEAVLEDINSRGVDKIFCLGDLAMAGPEPNKTIDFVKNQDWTVIQGNTDEMIAYYSKEVFDKVKEAAPIMANALKFDANEITEENKEYLKKLPVNLTLNIEGLRVLLVHGSPRKNNENIYPNMPQDKIEEIFKDVEADVVFCGHTHMPCGYQTKSKMTVVNDGSVGRPFTENPQSCYVLANVNNDNMAIIILT